MWWSFRARGRGPSNLGAWLAALVVAGLAGLVGLGDDAPKPSPAPAGEVVEQGTIEGVDYQIRRAGAGYEGWVVLDGAWSVLDQAHGTLEAVRAEIKRFVDWLHSGDPNPSVNQLQGLLDDAGVEYFSAAELLRIRHPSIADALGYKGSTFSAPAEVLANLADVAVVADQLRRSYAGPLIVLNGYRPEDYNDAVKGSDGSQHVYGRALDLTASDVPRLRSLAQAMFEGGAIRGLGLYNSNIHLDTRTSSPELWGSHAEDFA